ncbi:MAG: bifunctional DNA-formamidopyrimidine glycosylase/DNA-(apurinic or apyrimidinic site) lyase [Gammaproteobacteria bacterium]|nr:MAG: bifunctional DNA-formamidopyrimidine glycosylase/DNA-(apurinic or apyrimidinic site) lyase [Gammaproteobacteria bacterium]
MPELPEVETTRRGVDPLVVGHRLADVDVREARLRWPVDLPASLAGQTLVQIARRAKYLLFIFEEGVLILHLGMSGSLRVMSRDAPFLKHDHLVLNFEGDRSLRLHDPRRFGSAHWQPTPSGSDPLEAASQHRLLRDLGVEPLDPDFDGTYLKSRARGRRVAVKNFIMDSHVVVGVGNIYANEALFLAGIRPTVQAGRVSLAGYGVLAHRIRQVLAAAIQMGGTTLRDFVNQDGNPGYFRQVLNVYDREGEPCRLCDTPLKGIRLGGRATVYCSKCQRAQGFRR